MLVTLSTNLTNADFVNQRDNMGHCPKFFIHLTKNGLWDMKFLQGGVVLELDYK